jgi:hypothetical protein
MSKSTRKNLRLMLGDIALAQEAPDMKYATVVQVCFACSLCITYMLFMHIAAAAVVVPLNSVKLFALHVHTDALECLVTDIHCVPARHCALCDDCVHGLV